MLSDFYHIGSAIAVFLGFVIITRKDKQINDYLLASWLIIMGSNIFLFHRLIDHQENTEILTLINYLLLASQLPLPFLYVQSFYKHIKIIFIQLLLHIAVPISLFLVISLTAGLQHFETSGIIKSPNAITILFYSYIILGMPIYLIIALSNIKKLKQISLQQVSELYNNDFIIIKRFYLGLLLSYICFISLILLSFLHDNINTYTAFGSSIVILSLSVIYAGVFGLQSSELFTIHNYKKSNIKPSNSNIEQLNLIATKLDKCMHESKAYLRPRLSLKELSEISTIPEHQISSAINTVKKQNFYDYINSLRIEEFISRCKTQDKYNFTLTAIAFECGFNSKSTFYDIFKKQTGQTPSQFIKSL